MNRLHKVNLFLIALLFATSCILWVSYMIHVAGSSTLIVVTPDNMNGWGFYEEAPAGSGAIILGPSIPPLGSGSAQLTVNDTGGELFGTFAFAGTRLDTITSLAYSTYRSSGADALAPSLQFDIDPDVTDSNTDWQGRLVYEPYYTHTVSTGVWQTWDTIAKTDSDNWWFTDVSGKMKCLIDNPCKWSKILSSFPNIGIRSAGANTGATQFKAGSGWTGGFVGNVDAFSIGVNNVVTTYDFELPFVAQFSLDNPGDVAAGTRIGYTVTRKDQFGNLITTGDTTVYLYSSSDGVNKKFYDVATGGNAVTSIVIPDGFSSIGFWQYDEKAGNWFITVSDNSIAPDNANGIADASDAITVQPAAVAIFSLNNPGNMSAGTRLGYTVTRKDQFDNLVTSGVTLAYLYSTSVGTTTAFYTSAIGGAQITSAVINDGQSSSNFWYYDDTPGTWLVTASDSATAPPNGPIGIQDAVDSVTVSSEPVIATRFVILPVAGAFVNSPITITVQAQDANGNIDTTYQTGVTLNTSDSATGGGLVNIANGVGAIIIQDAFPEVVTLSLSDTKYTGLDVSSVQTVTFSIVPETPPATGGGGGAQPIITGVQLSGFAFANARVDILAVSPQATRREGYVTAAADGSFTITLNNIEEGSSAYGLIGTDALGRISQNKIFTANYANKNSLLVLSSVLLSPTLGIVHPTVRTGDVVGFVGAGIPGYVIEAQIDGKTVSSNVNVAPDGSYKIILPTAGLALGSHTARVRQISRSGVLSDYTPQKIFIATSLFTPQTDFNQDGVVNIQDWSVFISRWSSAYPSIRILNDLNGDGKVDITDISIFIRTLKF